MLSLEEGFKVFSGIFAELELYKQHTEGSEGSRSNVSVLVSGCVQWSKAPRNWHLFSCFICPLQLQKAAEQRSNGLKAFCSVCGSVLRVLSLPVGLGLGRNLRDICCLAHPSRNVYLFINCFYEDCMDCTCSSSLLSLCSEFTSHDLMAVQQHSLPPAL